MHLRHAARAIGLVAAFIGALPLLAACGDAAEPRPAPDAVETARALSRSVTIDVPAGPVREVAGDPPEAVTLDARVFGSGRTGVILAHMRPADQTAWFAFATHLVATGDFTVLTFDFRGYGVSTGHKSFEWLDSDLQAAYDYMRDTLGLKKVFLVGASMGGTASLVVGAHAPTAGIASISAPAQFGTLDAIGAVARITSPQLYVTSEGDVPAKHSLEQLTAAASRPVDRQVYEGDAHGTNIFDGPHAGELEQRLIDFLRSN